MRPVGQAEGELLRVQETVPRAEPRLDDVRAGERELPAHLVAFEYLNVALPPLVLSGDQFTLAFRIRRIRCHPKVSSLSDSQRVAVLAGGLGEVQEHLDRFPNQLPLRAVVELKAESSGRDGGGQRAERRASLQDDRLEPRT